MKVLKWVGIVVVGLILLGLLLPDSDKKAETKTESSKTSKDDIEVVKFSENTTGNVSTVHVEVKNNTEKLLQGGQIKIVYEDEKGNLVGTGNGTILNLASGASKVVDCMAVDIVGAANYKVEVTPMMYE